MLHTWNQELDYHVHMHCIISGGGLTPDRKIRKASSAFFIPVYVLGINSKENISPSWIPSTSRKSLFSLLPVIPCRIPGNGSVSKTACITKTGALISKRRLTGFGNAIEYLGRYTHRIAISNNRILSVSETEVTFSARGKKPGEPKRQITLSHKEFIRRFLMHVLPSGFQKIRYYGFLNNRMKSRNLKLIFRIQGRQRFRQRYAGMSMAELLKAVWNIDLSICPECGCASMQQLGRSYAPSP